MAKSLMKKLLYIQYCDASGYNSQYIQRVYDRLDLLELMAESDNTDTAAHWVTAMAFIDSLFLKKQNRLD